MWVCVVVVGYVVAVWLCVCRVAFVACAVATYKYTRIAPNTYAGTPVLYPPPPARRRPHRVTCITLGPVLGK
jgi:hypothetical protein